MSEVNVLFINGWGGALTSQSIYGLRERTIAEFGRSIYCPPPVNHTETGLILRYMAKWKDALIPVGLSCGCSTINAVMEVAPQGERVPAAFYYSPSMYCGVGKVPAIVKVAVEVNSWAGDFFNPFSRNLIVPAPGNETTRFERMESGMAHGFTPKYGPAQVRLFMAIRDAQKGI